MNALYRLSSNLNHPANRAETKGTGAANRLIDYFVYDKGDSKFLSFVAPRFVAQGGYTALNISQTDYIEGPGAIPLFSESFVSKVGDLLKRDLELHKCVVECHGQNVTYFAGKTLSVGAFVDSGMSSFHTLTDGTKILERAAYRTDWRGDFQLVREASDRSRLLATDKFRDLVAGHDLKIRLLEPI
jgi:hypothetical protein